MRALERLMLILAGLATIGAGLLPFLVYEAKVGGGNIGKFELPELKVAEIVYSGEVLVRTVGDVFELTTSKHGDAILEIAGEAWQAMDNWQDMALFFGVLFVLGGPLYFALFGLGYLIRGIIGKSYKRGIFFNIFYLIVSWLVFYLWLAGAFGSPSGPCSSLLFRLSPIRILNLLLNLPR